MTVVINGTTGIDTGTGSLIAADSTTPTYLDLFEDTDNGSNYVRLIAPTSVASNRTITLPDGTGTVAVNGVSGVLVSGTAITLTNQTAPEFTGIPSWAKRITLMFQGVSPSSTGASLIQLGTGSTPTYTTSGYLGSSSSMDTAVATTPYTTGFGIRALAGTNVILHGNIVIANVTGNVWTASGNLAFSNAAASLITAGSVSLGAALTAVRLFIDGTQFFDAGTINIFYE